MCFDHRGIIPLWFDQIVVFVKSQNHINFCYYLALVVRQFVIQVSPFNLHRNNLVEMSTVSTTFSRFVQIAIFVFWFKKKIIHCRLSKAVYMTMRHTVPRLVQHDNVPYGNTSSVFHMAICHTVPRPVSFKWQCVIRYHDQRLSHGTKDESSTPSSDEVYLFSDLGKLCDFLRIQLLKDDSELFSF
jgi:hypothetical protein